jgi:hypothetical protein
MFLRRPPCEGRGGTRHHSQPERLSREGFEVAYAVADGAAARSGRRQPSMLYRDPPDHTRLRAVVSRTFTPRAMEVWRPRVQQLVDELLDRVQDTGAMDVIADLAAPLPVAVIGELLGVPPGDRAGLVGLSADVARSLDALPVPGDRQLVERGRTARRGRVDPLDPGEIDAREAMEVLARIEGRGRASGLPRAGRVGQGPAPALILRIAGAGPRSPDRRRRPAYGRSRRVPAPAGVRRGAPGARCPPARG